MEQTAGGYEVAFEDAATDQFSIWNTDSNGNFLSFAVYAGSSTALETLETSFQQDLNGDGVIGVSSTTIEAFGIDEPGSDRQAITSSILLPAGPARS